MGIASMVIGIVSVILGLIPFCGYFALIPAIVGLVLGIIDTIQKSKKGLPKGMSVSGIVLNGASILLILLWTIIFISAGEFEPMYYNL